MSRFLPFALSLPLAAAVALSAPVARSAQLPAEGTAPPVAEQPLAPLDAEQAPQVDPVTLQSQLLPLLAVPQLGPAPNAIVLDATTGATLLDLRGDEAIIPASSQKVATAIAVLSAYPPDHRFATTVAQNPDGSIVLVGGGDPWLTTVAADDGRYPRPARLSDLAAATIASLQQSQVTEISLRYDNSLFEGPTTSPDWDPSFVPLDIVQQTAALTAAEGSPQIPRAALNADPAAAVAVWFADQIGAAGITVTDILPGSASPSAPVLAKVQSPTLAALVDRMLAASDNSIAESLFRLAAIGQGLPGSLEGGQRAVTAALEQLEIPVPGLVVRDGSGLSRGNRQAPITLAASLLLTVEPAATQAAKAEPAVTWGGPGLAVGGFTGTLADRFSTLATQSGAGQVHAKTGTLTGVASLTGITTNTQGRPLVFALVANGVPAEFPAKDAVDRFAATLSECGCAAPPA